MDPTEVEKLAAALAVANGHPDPAAYAAAVREAYVAPPAPPATEPVDPTE